MKKTACCFFVSLSLLLFLPAAAFAEDRSADVSAGASSVAADGTKISTYPYQEIDKENPRANLARITVTFRNTSAYPLYDKSSDRVSFFVKLSKPEAIGWVDLNANGEYESNEELSDFRYSAADGFYIENSRLTRASSVMVYLGSETAGSFNAGIYAAANGKKGELIGSVSVQVQPGNFQLYLIACDESGERSLGGHTGTVQDPHQVTPGVDVVLKAHVSLNNESLEDKQVEFYKAFEGEPSIETGIEETDDEGWAESNIKEPLGGLHCFYALLEDGTSSNKIYVYYTPEKATSVSAFTEDDRIFTVDETYSIKFSIGDKYGNRVTADKEEKVEFNITDAPAGSTYSHDYLELSESNDEGFAVLSFTPDRAGDYTIRCELVDGNRYDQLRVNAQKFERPVSMLLDIKAEGVELPSVRYWDENGDNVPDKSGRLVVKLQDAAGAEVTANTNPQYRLTFVPGKDAIEINRYGDITVIDESFRGYVPVTVTEGFSKVTTRYNLLVAGPPVSLAQTVQVSGRKAEINLRYRDNKNNNTWSRPEGDYKLILPQGVSAYNIKKFDRTGLASFTLLAEDEDPYDITVSASSLRKTFSVGSGQAASEPAAKRFGKIVMFLGMKGYTQGDAVKTTEVAPFVRDGRTFVAVRPVAEAFGALLDWNPDLQRVTLTRDGLTLKMVIGSTKIEKISDGIITYQNADVPAFIQDGRTVLPFRAVGEAFGAKVEYDPDSRSVSYSDAD